MKYQVNILGATNFSYFNNKRQALRFASKLAKNTKSQVAVNIQDSLWVPFTSKTSNFYSQFIRVNNGIYRHSGGGLVSVNRDGNFTY